MAEFQKRPKKTSIEYMCKGSFPLDRAGTIALPKLPERQFVEDYLQFKKLDEELLTEHFSGMFTTFLSGLAAKDY